MGDQREDNSNPKITPQKNCPNQPLIYNVPTDDMVSSNGTN